MDRVPARPMKVAEWRRLCRADIAANRTYPKSIVILLAFRFAQLMRSRPGLSGRICYLPVATSYKLLTEWLLGVEIPPSTQVGAGLRLRHGVGVVVNPAVIIGENVMLRHGVTLGNRHEDSDCPVIGDGVELGAGATVIGAVTIGQSARIGAGAVVVTDVPPNGVARGPKSLVEPPKPEAP